MINTITLNPSIDYIVNVPKFEPGTTNRSESEEIYPGGKGINVAIVAQNLGQNARTLGFLAGFSGEEVRRLIAEYGLRDEFFILDKGFTRINVKIKSDKESEINGDGPYIGEADIKKLYEKIESLENGEYLVLAGSIPKSLPSDIYKNIMEDFEHKEFKIVVDATGELLINVLKMRPFLIKPNLHELEETFGVIIKSQEDIIKYMKKLQDMGAKNIIVSLGRDGAIMLTQDGQLMKSGVPEGKLINSVGAGDSMVAGFLSEFIESKNYQKSFRNAIATGSASAFSSTLAQKKEVMELLDRMKSIELLD